MSVVQSITHFYLFLNNFCLSFFFFSPFFVWYVSCLLVCSFVCLFFPSHIYVYTSPYTKINHITLACACGLILNAITDVLASISPRNGSCKINIGVGSNWSGADCNT